MSSNLVRREALPQFGNQQSSTSMCYFAFQAFPCPASSTSAAQVARPTSADVTSAAVPMGTGAITTTVIQGWFGQSSTVVGRLVDIQTTDQLGRQSTIEAFSAPGVLMPVSPQPTAAPSTVASRLASTSAANTLAAPTTVRSSSFAMSSAVPSETSASGIANAANGASQTATAQSTSHQGLSTGALVAAVVIPIIVVLLLLGLGACCFVRRRRKQSSFKYGDEFTPRTSSRGKLFGGIFRRKSHSVAESNRSGPAESSGEVTLASRGLESSHKSLGSSPVLPAISVPALGTATLATEQRSRGNSASQQQYHFDSEKTTPGSDPFTDRHAPVTGMAFTNTDQRHITSQPPTHKKIDSNFLIPRRSVRATANNTGRTSLDDDDETRSAFSDSEYHDAELGSAAVGVAQRASVINMIITGNGNRSSGQGSRGSRGSQSTQNSDSPSSPKQT